MTSNQDHSDKFFLLNIVDFLLFTLNPRFLLTMLGLVLLGALVFVVPFLGLLLNLLMMALSFKFAVDILLASAEGHFKPEDVSFSGNDYLVVVQVVVLGIILNYLTNYAYSQNNTMTLIIIYGLQFVMPAIYMVLAYSGSLLQALNPVTLIRFIKPWFFTYAIFSLFYLLTKYLETVGVVSLIFSFSSLQKIYFVTATMMIFFMFLNFHIMGFLIYQNFNKEEDSEDNYVVETDSQSDSSSQSVGASVNPIYSRIQRALDSGATEEAMAIINDLQNSGDNSEELLALKNQLSNLDQDSGKKSDAEKIHALIKENKVGTALKLYEDIQARNEVYEEHKESDPGALAQHAFRQDKYALVLNLLKGFHKKHPDSKLIVPNYFLVGQVLYKKPQTKAKALAFLNNLVSKYSDHEMIPEIKSWIKGIELIQNRPKSTDLY